MAHNGKWDFLVGICKVLAGIFHGNQFSRVCCYSLLIMPDNFQLSVFLCIKPAFSMSLFFDSELMGIPKDVPYTPCKRMPFGESNCFAVRIFDLRAHLQTRTMQQF